MNVRTWPASMGLAATLLLAGCEAISMPFAKDFDNPADPIVIRQNIDAMSLPAAPAGVKVTSSDGVVVMTWDAVSGADEYKVWYAEGTAAKTTDVAVDSAKIVDRTATIDGLTNGIEYAFIVVASNPKGDGPVSAVVTATPKAAVPDAPSGLKTTAGSGVVVVTWDTVAGADGYKVYYAKGTTASATDSAVDATKIKDTTATIDSLTNGTEYAFVVVAYNARGDGLASAAVTATPKVGVPDAPVGVKATATDGQVVVTWNAVAGADGYRVYYVAGTTATIADTSVASKKIIDTTATVDALVNGTQYAFVVVAYNISGDSNPSAATTATPKMPAPSGLKATSGDKQIVVTWDAVTGAESYAVYYAEGSTAATTDTAVASSKIAGTTATLDGLTNGTKYAFVVVAKNAGGESGVSTVITAIPMPGIPSAPSGLTATAGDGQIVVGWNAVAGADSYKVYYAAGTTATTSDTLVAASSVSGTQATVTDLVNKTTYAFIVVAVNASGTSAASAVFTRAAGVYTLTYDTNGASTGQVPATAKSYGYGTVVTVLGNTSVLTKATFTFSGWNTKADGSGTAYATGATVTIDKDITLYARWQLFTDFQWTAASTLPANHSWTAVTWGNDRFVAISSETSGGGYSAYSTDGKNWTTSASAVFPAGLMSFVTYGNGVFVATNWTEYGATPTAAWSTDGLTWTTVTLPQGSGKGLFLAFGNGHFVITAFNPQPNPGGYVSTNGKTWSPGVLGYSDDCWGLAYGNGTFVTPIFGENRVLASTDNGASWVGHSVTLADSLTGVGYGNGVWMVRDCGGWNSANSTMKWSTDLVNWYSPTSGPSKGYGDFVSGNGVILSNGSATTSSLYSLNGKDWATVTSPFTNNLGACAYGNGMWVALNAGQAYWSQ